jgi:hypothetical protein
MANLLPSSGHVIGKNFILTEFRRRLIAKQCSRYGGLKTSLGLFISIILFPADSLTPFIFYQQACLFVLLQSR